MPDLSGRVGLVTGSAGGIGAAIISALVADGATVHGVDRDTSDVADPEQVAALIDRIGTIDTLVNCAGGVCGQIGKPLEDVSDDDWRSIVDANLTSTFVCTRAVVAGMKAAGFGRIVASAGAEVMGTPEETRRWAALGHAQITRPEFVERVVALGWADRKRLEAIGAAFLAWGEHPDAFQGTLLCQAVAWAD